MATTRSVMCMCSSWRGSQQIRMDSEGSDRTNLAALPPCDTERSRWSESNFGRSPLSYPDREAVSGLGLNERASPGVVGRGGAGEDVEGQVRLHQDGRGADMCVLDDERRHQR